MAFYYKKGVYLPIPKAPWYVLSNDLYMSKFGPPRQNNQINVCVVPCDTYKQAESVERYVRTRSDQKRIRIVYNPPRSNPGRMYSLVLGWKDLAAEMEPHIWKENKK